MEIITLFPDRPYSVDDRLEMTVLFITEEWCDSERRAEVHVTVKMKTPQIEEEIDISTENPHLIWRDYELEYQGGWLKAIQFGIRRTDNHD